MSSTLPPETTPALLAMRRSMSQALRPSTVAQVLSRQLLESHYQPIVELRTGTVTGHESLVRGPADSPLRGADALFQAARIEGLSAQLERACISASLACWAARGQGKRIFLNLSANGLVDLMTERSTAGAMRLIQDAGIDPAAVVIEITEHERVADLPALVAVADSLRAHGLRFALDDFGDGRSSLRLWAELRPEIVKIDKYFISGLHNHAVKVQTIKGLTRFAEIFGTELVAEGIETEAELRAVRDLGISLGQGYLLGRPQEVPAMQIPPSAMETIASTQIAVLPEMTRAASAQLTAGRLAVPVAPISPDLCNDEVARLLSDNPSCRALAIVENGRPVGLLNRQNFVDRHARPFHKELYGRKSCMLFANATPLTLDCHAGLDAMAAILTSADQRYLSDGFIVTEGGRYLGVGTGEQLVRVVTEVRIEAARHANPLTFLPGNIPISEHIDRLLAGGGEFVACYADLNDFKPYNDHYGYWRGDDMIRLVASTLAAHCDARSDFVGHVGGDDFVVLFQSSDWLDRCEAVVKDFNEKARNLFDGEALEAGGIEAEDRHGVRRFFKLTTLSIGAVPVQPGQFQRVEQVATAAAAAKHQAKLSQRGLAIGCATRA